MMLVTTPPAFAQASSATGERLIEAVAGCRGIADVPTRVACYDRAADDLARARANNDLTVMSRDEVTERRRSLFGLSVDDGRLFGRSAASFPRIETLESTVARLAIAGRDLFTVTLADGSVWRTTEAARVRPAVKDTVHIRRGALNGFFASFAGARSVRIERVR